MDDFIVQRTSKFCSTDLNTFELYFFVSTMAHISCLQKMEILPVDDLDIALHDFVSKDDKTAFYACLQRNLDETRV